MVLHSMLSYSKFFASITNDTMSPPPTDPPEPTVRSDIANEETLNVTRTWIQARGLAVREMSSRLKVWIEEEEAKLESLAKGSETENCPSRSAIARRVAETRGLLESVKKNYQAACDRFAAVQELALLGFAVENLLAVERRLRAVEVGLQGLDHSPINE